MYNSKAVSEPQKACLHLHRDSQLLRIQGFSKFLSVGVFLCLMFLWSIVGCSGKLLAAFLYFHVDQLNLGMLHSKDKSDVCGRIKIEQ